MEHTPVKSSFIQSVGHDPETSTLEVTFKNGKTYRSEGVSADAHAALLSDKSVGGHWTKKIQGIFPTTAVEGGEEDA